MKWGDATSYSRGDRERIPRTWELPVSDVFKITITRHIHYSPETWLLYCPAIGISLTPCPSADLEEAKQWALDKVSLRLTRWLAALEKAIAESAP